MQTKVALSSDIVWVYVGLDTKPEHRFVSVRVCK